MEELDIDYYENLVENRLWLVPITLIKPVGKGVLVRQSDQYGYTKTEGGIIIPGGAQHEKKYNLVEVVAIGEEVPSDKIAVGDIAVIQRSTAFRLPNGLNSTPSVWRVMYDTMHIIAVLPNLVAERLSSRYDRSELLNNHVYKDLADRYAKGDITAPKITDFTRDR